MYIAKFMPVAVPRILQCFADDEASVVRRGWWDFAHAADARCMEGYHIKLRFTGPLRADPTVRHVKCFEVSDLSELRFPVSGPASVCLALTASYLFRDQVAASWQRKHPCRPLSQQFGRIRQTVLDCRRWQASELSDPCQTK